MDVFFTAPLDNGSNIGAIYQFFNAGSYVDYSFAFFVPTAGQTELDLEAATLASQIAYATAHSYTVTNTQKWYDHPVSLYKSYQEMLSQSGTSAPSGTNLVNSFGATTFTLARTSAGVYTITASAATFTAGKTALLFSPLTNPLANLIYAVTSTTVITITTSINSLISLLGLGFQATPTDAILSGTLVEVRVYP